MDEIHQGYIERDLAAVRAAKKKLEAAIAKYVEAQNKADLASVATIDARTNLHAATQRFHVSVEASKNS